MPDVSVIIVNYRCAQLTADCIRSVFGKTKGVSCEVVVVDNASGDGSAGQLKEVFDGRISVIESPVNLGFGRANNLGAKHASGEYLFLLNPDTVLVNDAVSLLCDYMRAHPEVGVAGGNLYAPDMSPTPSFCRKFDDLKMEKKNASWMHLLLGKAVTKLSARMGRKTPMKEFVYGDQPERVAYIFGADMMLPKQVFDEVGGFDPDFFMYGEEEELTWRITQRGYRVVCVPQAKIIHLEGATTSHAHGFSKRQFSMRMHGALTYYKKRFGDEGAAEFFRLRTLRYDRLMKIADIQGKLTEDFPPAIQKKCLAEVYQAFLNN